MHKLKEYINYVILIDIVFLIIGLLLIIFPKFSIETIADIISICFILSGGVFIFNSLQKMFSLMYFVLGIFQLLFGFVLFNYPELVTVLIPITIGMWMVTKSVIDCRLSFVLKKYKDRDWILVCILSILAIICGLMTICNPTIASITFTVMLGVMLAAYSLTTIITALFLMDYTKEIAKEFHFLDI